jgi:type II secretory pathway component PulC
VQTEPRFAKGHFHGWRLVSFYPGDARFAGVDLQAGDVITRVNGKSVEQPDQFMAVWTELRSAHELVVDVERAGTPRTLRWTIADK